VYGLKTKDKNNFLTLLLILKFAEYKKSADSLSEILLFLAKYSFLFQNLLIESDLCEAENSQLYIAQENREIGARYLDPRYSMWISTDPALGEYIPKAPVNEEAKRYNQNLPGMGGIFNHINSNLYHYAGNNPVKYTDPTGRDDTISDLSDEQKEFVSARKTEALEGLKKIKNTLQEYVNDTEGKVVLSESMKNSISDFLGMTDSKEDVQKIIEKLDTLITFIDGLTLEDFKYDSDRHRTENEDGTKSQWVAYVSNKSLPIYLCPYFFENNSSKKTSAGTLVHEVTHIEFKTRDITYNEQECKDLSNNRKLKNAQNWRFFYEANK